MSEKRRTVEIRVAGRLDERWITWLGAEKIEQTKDGDSVLTCTVVDQAHLFGTLRRIQNLGLPLLDITSQTEDHTK